MLDEVAMSHEDRKIKRRPTAFVHPPPILEDDDDDDDENDGDYDQKRATSTTDSEPEIPEPKPLSNVKEESK